MPIHFTCPHCGTATDVADEYAGLRGPCASCHNTIDIPALPAAEPPAEPAVETHDVVVEVEPLVEEPGRLRGRWVAIALVLLISTVLVAAGLAFARWGQDYFQKRLVAQEATCRQNLARIAQALRAYHDRYESFPPAVVYSADGRPMHSWRVLILPFLGEDELYRAYDFNQPWNGPKNRQLFQRIPAVLACPNDRAAAKGHTSYLAVVGRETAWPTGGVLKLSERPPEIAEKILVVEAADSGFIWLQPQDLRFDLMNRQINNYESAGVGSSHLEGAYVVLIDGTVKHLSDATGEEQLVDLLTIGPPPAPPEPPKPPAEEKQEEPAEEMPTDDKPTEPDPAVPGVEPSEPPGDAPSETPPPPEPAPGDSTPPPATP